MNEKIIIKEKEKLEKDIYTKNGIL